MTDPSHAWHFAPFSQCQALVEAAENGAERAYALGCFLHGITDNNVHHVVNYFSGETFTLYPKDAARDGELRFSLLNVVRHITVEKKIEDSLAAARPEAFEAERMEHRIAKDLYRRVYLDTRSDGRGLWHWAAGELVQRKNDALRAAHLNGFDPTVHLETSIESIREAERTVELDGRLPTAYAEFLETGGAIEILGQQGGLEAYEYVLLLPELIEDMKRLLDLAEAHGDATLEDTVAQWQARGQCSVTCPLLFGHKNLLEHLFAPRNGGRSRFGEVVDIKKIQLDGVLDGYIGSVERLSNLIVAKGPAGIGRDDLEYAMRPLTDSIDEVTDFPYQTLFPGWAVDVIANVAPLEDFLHESFALLTAEFERQIIRRMTEYTEQLKAQLLELSPQAVQDLHAKAQELRDIAIAQLDEAQLELLGIDLEDADAAFANFETSVLYMNSYNSIAGALANPSVAFSRAPTSFFGGGAVSFDASFQVAYSQLSVCEDLAEVFYPCGTSAIEALQGDYEDCKTLDVVTPEMDPHVECHGGSATAWADDPVPEECESRTLSEIIAPEGGHVGSYTLAFPPALAHRGPECVDPIVPGITDADGSFDVGGTPLEEGDTPQGCACTLTQRGSGSSHAWLWLLALGSLARRRGRALVVAQSELST